MNSKIPAKSIAAYGLLAALSLVFSYAETLIPVNIGVPGAKLGLANAVTLSVMYAAGLRPAFFIGVLRIVLAGFLFGSPFTILYSVSGFLLSILSAALAKRSGVFGITGISVIGGVMHNVGQLGCAAALLRSPYVFTYFPALLFAGVLAGTAVGILSGLLTKRVSGYIMKLEL